MTAVSHLLSDFILEFQWGKLPPEVQREAARTFLNWVGCTVGGSNTEMVDAAMRGVKSLRAPGTATVLGRPERLHFIDAALIDGISSSAHAFDDTHLPTIIHPTGPVAAAALAFTQTDAVEGERFLAAIAVGMEIECRLGNAITGNGAVAPGWFMTGLTGGVGAAAAIAQLMKLDHTRCVWTLGLAASQASGLRATHGSMAVASPPGREAQHALMAAHMAREGFTCSDRVIDGTNGLLQLVAPGGDPDAIGRRLGSSWELMQNAYKPYPCGIVIHPAIDACLEFVQKRPVAPDEIERVDLQVHPDTLRLCWRKLPSNTIEAQTSLYHWVAAALTLREAGLSAGEQACVEDPKVRGLQTRIHAEEVQSLGRDQAAATFTIRGGTHHRVEIAHATGSLLRPMSDAALDAKFIELARRVLPEDRVQALLSACHAIRSSKDVAEIARLGSQ